MCLRQGTLLQGNKYRIEKVLGQGGFGITYLAEQTMLASKVAIKEFFFKEYCERSAETSYVRIGVQSNKEIVEKFMRKFMKEAQMIARFQHSNIIQIKDVFRENGTVYYVMDYIEGESLGDMVGRLGSLSENVAMDYIRQVAMALDYIHKQHVNHLDIKPGNIMVRSKTNRAVLIDFGVSKQYDENTQQGTETAPVCITPGYSPPEQYYKGGLSSFSPQSDIYALGATLFKLLTGKTPPAAMEIPQYGLPSVIKKLSKPAQMIIMKSMQLRKQDRPQNAAAFLKLMDSVQKNPMSLYPSTVTGVLVVDDEEEEKEKEKEPFYIPNLQTTKKAKQKGTFLTKKIWIMFFILFCIACLCIILWPSPKRENREFANFCNRGDSIINIEKQEAYTSEPVDYTESKRRLDAAILQYEKALQQETNDKERRECVAVRLNNLRSLLPTLKMYMGVCDSVDMTIKYDLQEQIAPFRMKRDSISNIIKSNIMDL